MFHDRNPLVEAIDFNGECYRPVDRADEVFESVFPRTDSVLTRPPDRVTQLEMDQANEVQIQLSNAMKGTGASGIPRVFFNILERERLEGRCVFSNYWTRKLVDLVNRPPRWLFRARLILLSKTNEATPTLKKVRPVSILEAPLMLIEQAFLPRLRILAA